MIMVMTILPLQAINVREINDKALAKAVGDGNLYKVV